MGYTNYHDKFKEPRLQHNIMAIVGNGFDIQVLGNLGVSSDTRYPSFFYFLKSRNFNESNLIFAEMSRLQFQNQHCPGSADNWSDVEEAINGLHGNGTSAKDIEVALDEIQAEFAIFLDQVVTPQVLTKLSQRTVDNRLTMSSLMEFLGDIAQNSEYRKMSLPAHCNIGDIFNFLFINLNYTSLLDNFLYLDKTQFAPHPYATSDRLVTFHPNPRGHSGELKGPQVQPERSTFTSVAYLTTAVIHPHGAQGIPRSLLFGIDSTTGTGRILSKPYWAQNEVKYADLFSETSVFIIFGSSLGDTDRWWWRSILETLIQEEGSEDESAGPDIIIYWYTPDLATREITEDQVRTKFVHAAGLEDNPLLRQKTAEHVRVVFYAPTTPRAWLNTDPDLKPTWSAP